MKKSELTFSEGFDGIRAKEAKKAGNGQKVFDWDKAAEIIKKANKEYKDLVVEAVLQRDWAYTGGIIFEEGKPNSEDYIYLSSNWAIPTLILNSGGKEIEEVECYTKEKTRFSYDSKWDKKSLKILNS